MNSQVNTKTWICLSHPSDIRNVGGALRAVANFGLAGLKLITQNPELSHSDELIAFSSGAYHRVKLQVYQELSKALEDASLVIGTSRRPRGNQGVSALEVHDIGRVCERTDQPHVVFGNERVGLSYAELDLCHYVAEIHSVDAFPSLNLAHAVACVGYELARPKENTHLDLPREPSERSRISSVAEEAFYHRVVEVSDRIGYPPSKSPELFARQLRSLLRRASGEAGDYGLILGIIRELDRLGTVDQSTKSGRQG